jgi:hypothetical protein
VYAFHDITVLDGHDANNRPITHGESEILLKPASAPATQWTRVLSIRHDGSPNSGQFDALAVDSRQNLFLAGDGTNANGVKGAMLWEVHAGSSTPLLIDEIVAPDQTIPWPFTDLTFDSAGNLLATARVFPPFTATTYNRAQWVVHKGTPDVNGDFNLASFRQVDSATVDVLTSAQLSSGANAITTINSGKNAGIYVAGKLGNAWIVRRSTDGGNSWRTIDSFIYDTTSAYSSDALSLKADNNGNLCVVGYGSKRVQTGGTKTNPIYSDREHWIVRMSANGGTTWKAQDEFTVANSADSLACDVGFDTSGTAYVVGYGQDSGGMHALIRSNSGGAWHMVDEYQPAGYAYGGTFTSFANDPAGNLYVGGAACNNSIGQGDLLIRTTAPVTQLASAFSSTQIISSSAPSATNGVLDLTDRDVLLSI